ncbi:MAG: glutamyl-tRNA reductase [Desulfovibrio sp.]|jgi:glutamyl-tRNA reductase|nr:glutamyl-tRNA reductase [Desulfovibrio sp.]
MDSALYLVGLNHKTAPLEVRECFALNSPDPQGEEFMPIGDGVNECMLLSTCNRVEILAVGKAEAAADLLVENWAKIRRESPERLRSHIYSYKGQEAVRHLFAVAASLDSMVLGEPQILGQLKDAYRRALKNGTAGHILNRLLHRAFFVAKRVRSETGIASSAVSVSYAAVELAKRIFEDMGKTRALLIGAGEMAELAATHLVNAGLVSLRVTNRTPERAELLAQRFHGEAAPFEKLVDHLAEADIIISSTGAPEALIRAEDLRGLMPRRKNKPMFFIDIAVPRDVDPAVNSIDNIYLYDIDDLKEIVEENMLRRRAEAARGQDIVDEESLLFCAWMRSLALQPTIVDLVRRGENIARHELTKTMKQLGPLPEGAQGLLETMLSSVVRKLNHEPITYLKRAYPEHSEAGTRHISLVRRIFNLDNEKYPDDYPKQGLDD